MPLKSYVFGIEEILLQSASASMRNPFHPRQTRFVFKVDARYIHGIR